MSSTEEGSRTASPRRNPLRNATLILPRTGERVKRMVTLSSRDSTNGSANGTPNTDADSETEPLLARRRPQGFKKTKRKIFQRTSEKWLKKAWAYATSRTGVGILKCSIAYLIGSMGTFFPPFSNFLGHNDGKHMMATVTVYFHSARSLGSMFEAVFIALIAFLYAAFVSFTSMAVSIFFDDVVHKIILGHVLVLIVFVGGGLGLVGWTKQSLGNPLVNVGCSLTSLALITVLTKEGAVQAGAFSPNKIEQVLKMVIMGVMSTFTVNILIMPISARKDVRLNLIDVTDSFSDMLAMITRGFLTGSEIELQQGDFQNAHAKYKRSQAALGKNLKEAKWEHYALGTESEHKLESALVKCLQRMAQNMGGLRSAATTQFALLKQSAAGASTPVPGNYFTTNSDGFAAGKSGSIDFITSSQDTFNTLEAIAEAPEHDGVPSTPYSDLVASPSEIPALPTARSPSEIFERFIHHLGPSMKSLAYTLKQILDELPCGPAPNYEIKINSNFRSSLAQAVDLYSEARRNALSLLYRSKDLAASRPEAVEADFEEVAASCGYFSVSLLDFAEGVKDYLDILEDLKAQADRPRSWNWLKVWRWGRNGHQSKDDSDSESTPLIPPPVAGDPQQYSTGPAREPKTLFKVREQKRTAMEKILFRVWVASRFLRREDIKFAIKTGIGAAIFAMPSYVPQWRPFYSRWRGEWGLLSYMLVCSMTVGASNTTSSARIFGTCVGAVCAIIGWEISDGNVYVLAFFGWLMALMNFYIIVGRGNGPFGRFIMLTYNLSALYAYSLSVKDDDHDDDEGGIDPVITEIVLHRVVAVISGCLWGMVITRLVWPISARRKLRNGLSILLLRMGMIWKRDPLATLTEGASDNSYLNIKEELELQKYLSRLESLSSSASYEMHLKGPFAKASYSTVLKSVDRMLDAFHAMNVVIMKDPRASEGEAQILLYTKEERGRLCAIISHLFQVLASSLKLEFPLNDALPNTDGARDRLLAKIFKYRKECNKTSAAHDEDFAILYAFALVTGQLSWEIRKVVAEFEQLFGILDEESLSVQ